MVGLVLFVVILSIQAQAEDDDQQSCNKKSCKDSTDCSIGDACFPDPMLSGNRSFRNASCQSVDSPCLQSPDLPCAAIRSFIYNSTQQCPSCCGQGLGYRLYNCSPRIRSLNPAVLYAANVSDFNSTCSTQSAYSSEDLVVSLATGWIGDKTLCLTNINISAPNNRFIVAKVVTECKSAIGCDQESSFREPCAPNAVAGTAAVWSALGYDSGIGLLKNISWSLAEYPHSPSIPDQGGLGKSSRSSSGAAAIGASVAAAVILALSLLAIVGFIWNRRKKEREEAAIRSKQERELLQEMRLDQSLPHQFTLSDLQTATDNFSSNCKLGEGGFGSVFKGTLSDGSVVAVKRMDVEIEGSSSGQTQFKAEVMSIGSVHHFNLVRLRGFCIHSTSCLLVYEFLPNGSLDRWIFDRHHSELALEWRLRYSIAVDVARGLTYLHEGCREQVLHLDIKPQNILLDESFRARISDFGLCKLAERGKSYVVSGLRGTPGYMAPEWLNSTVTDRTDVYSFGIVLLQLVSSKKALLQPAAAEEMISSGDDDNLGGYVLGLGVFARNVYQSGRMKELIDPRLQLLDDRNPISLELPQFLRIALWCIQDDPQLRPTMEKVLQMLEGSIDVPELYRL